MNIVRRAVLTAVRDQIQSELDQMKPDLTQRKVDRDARNEVSMEEHEASLNYVAQTTAKIVSRFPAE